MTCVSWHIQHITNVWQCSCQHITLLTVLLCTYSCVLGLQFFSLYNNYNIFCCPDLRVYIRTEISLFSVLLLVVKSLSPENHFLARLEVSEGEGVSGHAALPCPALLPLPHQCKGLTLGQLLFRISTCQIGLVRGRNSNNGNIMRNNRLISISDSWMQNNIK